MKNKGTNYNNEFSVYLDSDGKICGSLYCHSKGFKSGYPLGDTVYIRGVQAGQHEITAKQQINLQKTVEQPELAC